MSKKLKIAVLINCLEKNLDYENKLINYLKKNNLFKFIGVYYITQTNNKKNYKINFFRKYFFYLILKIESFFYPIKRINILKKNYVKLKSSKKKYKVLVNKIDNSGFFRKEIDLLINLQQSLIDGDILYRFKFGVWSIHHGDIHFQRNGHVGFWEILERQEVMGITLQKLNNKVDHGDIIEIQKFKTLLPCTKSQVFLQSKTLNLILRNLIKLKSNKLKLKKYNKTKNSYKNFPTFNQSLKYVSIIFFFLMRLY